MPAPDLLLVVTLAVTFVWLADLCVEALVRFARRLNWSSETTSTGKIDL